MSACEAIVVIVVDDDASFRTGVAANLSDDGHLVHDYPDPRQVTCEHLAAAHIVVTDYLLADTDGITLADGLHGARPELVVVLVTAYWTVEVEAAVAARPFLHLCRKPLDYAALHARIHAVAGA